MPPRFSLVTLLLLTTAHTASAQSTPPQPAPLNPVQLDATPRVDLGEVDVVGATPLLGSGVERSQIPAATQILSSAQINRTGVPSLTNAILENIPAAAVNDVEGNPFQPDILYRGFTASPVAGTSEGLAVYVNGARFNDAFGDTVNWDLIPSEAIQTVNVEASNPIFGLNALGGSVNVQLKNGFTWQGAQITGYGGSFDRGAGIFEFGRQYGNLAIYAAGDITHDGGYRYTSASDIYRIFTDFGWRNDVAELHLAVTAADNTLGNPGATPTQAVNANIANIFTAPNEVYNKYVSVNLNGSYQLSDTTTITGLAYYQTLTQRIPNGATAEVADCGEGPNNGLLCNADGTPVTGRNGQAVPDFLNGGVYSALVSQGLDTHSYGASAQLTDDRDIAGLKNHFVVGASMDGSDSVFDGNTALGGFNPYTREYIGPGVVQDQPDEGVNPVKVATATRYYGVFAQDILTLIPGLNLILAGRFNNAEVNLYDKLGGGVRGNNAYNRFNPSAGLTYQLTPALQIYGNYTETNRVPTPLELSCGSPQDACTLLSFFVGDPPLKQVISRSFEAGLRGHIGAAGGRLSWDADYYHTKNDDDLTYESTIINPNLAYFTNAGTTLRQGVEANLRYNTESFHASLGYAFTDATFEDNLVLNGGSNPAQDENGLIYVHPGDKIPGIPRHRGNITLSYDVLPQWTIGGSAILTSSQYLFGDQSNQEKPLGGYAIFNLNTTYRVTNSISVFALVNNLLDQRYGTYGTFGPIGDVPWPNVPGGVTNPREESPGTPRAAYGGITVKF